MNKLFLLITFLFFVNLSYSQGLQENELTTNPVLVSKYKELKDALRTPVVIDTLNLGVAGILDDFSYEGTYPDTNLWIDNKVFINRDFAKAPITLGVATFEGLNETGYPYDFTAGPATSAVADYLTSKPINLNYPASDSIYFSFYYQPQGLGNDPESVDSLVLQFKHSVFGWRNVKAIRGTTLATNDSSWTLVMIPIKDTAYLKDDFQFRFFNRATISGNTDHWSIDYVYLNRIRSKNDTSFEDVSFVYNTPSLLYTYAAMPWRQYDTTDMKTNYTPVIRNNHTATKFLNFSYKIYDGSLAQVNTTYSATDNISPFASSGYMNSASITNPVLNYNIPPLTSAQVFSIECIINSSPDKEEKNDTVRHSQYVTNFFAYDDGTAESSLGLSTLYGKLAQKFVLKVADSMQFVDIYFNPFVTNTSVYTFNINVWNEVSGKPGVALYTGATPENPEYGMVVHNDFIRYKLDAPLYLSSGTYYVGFTQNTNQFLNVGFDKNINSQSKLFYNISGVWNNSPYPGSLMLRPVFGAAPEFNGIAEDEMDSKHELLVYPNPANDRLYFNAEIKNSKMNFSIIDLLGKTLIHNILDLDYIDISALENGVYFIQLNDGSATSTAKFIKVKQ